MGGPILARKEYRDRVPMVIFVKGGLHHMKGNSAPYFSLTYTAHHKGFPNQCWSGGAGHDTIRQHFGDRFDDLARLHLCDIDGAPMHAVANGWYWLAGALGGAGERFHGGNSQMHFAKAPEAIDPAKPWATTDYRNPTTGECLQIFADHMRISLDDAQKVRGQVEHQISMLRAGFKAESVKEWLAGYCDNLRPMWKRQADDCIKAHGLMVYGDEWPSAA